MSSLADEAGLLQPVLPKLISILLIEDDEDDYILTQDKLQQVDPGRYQLDWKDSFDVGLKAALAAQHDIIIVDYRLGAHTGLELLEAVRNAGLDTPVLLLTGQGDREIDMAAMRSGVDEYLTKNELTGSSLERAIRYSLQHVMVLRGLRESEARYERAVEGANDGIWDWNLDANEVYYSRRWKNLLGLIDAEVSNSPNEWLDRVHPDDKARVEQQLDQHLGGTTPQFNCEHRLLHENGEWLWILARAIVSADEGTDTPRHLAGSVADISRRKATEEQLLHDALHDPLTELPNRALFTDRLQVALKRTRRRKNYRFGVLFLDFDRFKLINDSLGHVAGDRLLIDVSTKLRKVIKPSDTLARLGGDEFAVLVDEMDSVGSLVGLAQALLDSINQPTKLENNTVSITASIGITVVSNRYATTDDVMRDTDMAMYRAKHNGRNRYEIFDATMHANVVNEVETVSELREALDNDQLELYYQPIVRLTDESIIGMEALLRWNRPGHGVLLPASFISIAEANQLIEPISEWVLERALSQLAELAEEFSFAKLPYCSVNLSALSFRDLDLPRIVRNNLEKSGAPANKLLLEVTESTLMQQRAAAYIVLTSVREMGVRVSIDDFGTGYSSLTYLHQFPFDVIKIDKSFVQAMERERRSLAIVRSVLSLAHGLNLNVIAEGIETVLQQRILQIEGCRDGQGFLFAKPMPFEEIRELLKSNEISHAA